MRIVISNNKKFIYTILSRSFMFFGFALIPSLILAYRDTNSHVFDAMFAISVIGMSLGKVASSHFADEINEMKVFKMRTCYMTTLLTWLSLIVLSALPYYFATDNLSVIDSLLLSCASWTTTGISPVNIAFLPLSLQLWHSTCNWLGGLGIIMLTLTMLPNWQFVGQNLVATEIPGPGFLKLKSTFRKSYRRLLGVYLLLTILCFISLFVAGMTVMQSVLTSMSCISTAGMLHINNGFITMMPMNMKIIITFFTFCGSINFSVPIMILLGKFKTAFSGAEFKFHVIKITVMIVFIYLSMAFVSGRAYAGEKIGEIIMQVISFVSTSAYIVSGCLEWPPIAKVLVTLCVFIGGCAVSTSGGIKNARAIIVLKSSVYGMFKHLHPRSVKTMWYNGERLKSQIVIRANLYMMMFMSLFIIGGVLLSLDTDTVSVALSYSQAMLTNSGISINALGHAGRVEGWSAISKIVMMFLMLAGRLEIYPMLLIFFRSFWFKNKNV